MHPDVMIVVVVHDSADTLDRCLTSIATAAADTTASVIVVDSGSTDDPQAVCARHGVDCETVPNRGLAAAFNHALAAPEVRAARYVLQLNPDVELPAGALDRLVADADQHPRCGILAPRQVDQHGRLLRSIGREPSAALYLRALAGYGADWVNDPARYETDGEADWVMGACMLLRSEMLAQTGGFDERFFLFSEEVDLCRRAREAGWAVRYTPSATVVHPISGRSPNRDRIRLEEWSRIVYLRKWHGAVGGTVVRLTLALRYSVLSLKDVVWGTPVPQRGSRLRLRETLRLGPPKAPAP
jgi:GT2 family glycosyltransferase